MMPALVSAYRRFAASTHGLAAIEFAMVLPVMLILLLASYDAGNGIALYMKVRSATYTLAAITNQYTTIQATDMDSIVGATSVVLAPYPSAPVVVTISQIKISSTNKTTVSWSYSLNGTALTQGTSVTLPSTLTSSNNPCGTNTPCYLIYGQVSYTFTPSFGFFAIGGISLSDSIYVVPRSSLCILYPPENVTTTSQC
jgi:Flp pilus assembly protein TadG